ncbi:MAG: GDSL-type esterase/lipase family protein [Kiritimatiellae bacterium]|jgi:lysophospholipase L1-like esterase|nr:GDSL-type esterase/lipase family protein [Kiritimatiellia bacterium]
MNQVTRTIICVTAALFFSQANGEKVTPVYASADVQVENSALIPVPKLEKDFYNWEERHGQILDLIKKQRVDLVFIGDSITHMFCNTPPSPIVHGSRTWDKYYAHRNAINMGFGWDRTQNVLWRLENGEFEKITPRVVVLLIGTNNQTGTKNARTNTPAEIAAGVAAICRTIHQKVPACHIILLGVLPRSPKHFVKPIEKLNKLIVPLNQEKYITFLNLRDQFADKDGLPKKELMYDTVHPNAAGYQVWAEAMEPLLSRLLKDKPIMPDQ